MAAGSSAGISIIMLKLRHVTKSRVFLSPIFIVNDHTFLLSSISSFSFSSWSSTSSAAHPFLPPAAPPAQINFRAKDVARSFKEWFKGQNNALMDRIYSILGDHDENDPSSRNAADAALSDLCLPLSERFVLDVLNYGKDVLSCLKFFDWAGRQAGFYHTRATFSAIFKIMLRAKLMSLMLDFLENIMKRSYVYKVRFYNVLVMGYAVAGKPEIALQLFGKMRFHGLDLDDFAYHVLLNALVEENCFDAVQVVSKQISMRGLESEITHSILVKSFCKQNRLEEAEEFLRSLVRDGRVLSGYMVGHMVGALCKSRMFDKASCLVEEFHELRNVQMKHAYSVMIKELVRAGKVDVALEFLQGKMALEGYVPDVFRYNILIYRLLKENRLEEVYDLLMEMKEGQIAPDKATINAALCFFCKAGMMDVALELYNSRSEFQFSPNRMAYNHLIKTLCGDDADEAYHVLRNSIDQGYFLGRKTFSILADALCREGKLDKMKELILVALEQNFMPSTSTYDKFISALCRARRVEDGYLIHRELNRVTQFGSKNTYSNLIYGLSKLNRGGIAIGLLIEMQEKGHTPTRKLLRAVVKCLFEMDVSHLQFFKFLEMLLSCHENKCQVYDFFIDGAGDAKKPELAREVFEMMQRSELVPNLSSDILMLQAYLKNRRISEALNFFRDLRNRREIHRKLYHAMIVGLCKANNPHIALEILREMRVNGVTPSLQCYEELVLSLCLCKRYDAVVNIVYDLEGTRHHISSFIGNVLLLHSLKSKELYEAWVCSRGAHDETSSRCSILGQLIGAFSGRMTINQNIEGLEEVINQCFPLDLYTYNMLLRRLTKTQMDSACELFSRLQQKGYEPNRWTYDILAQGFFKQGRVAEAKRWVEEMFRKGFDPTEKIKLLI
ncbi:pentatricopeptide repeat-containing protein At1g71210, mitochondrial [Malania oleifera]|uniref:pentatricopeptide repeat-containing protein At1g71210, mitochondrial n=1 Tax=Malania oleifera TaxID=397392 RepID=UPI0025ADAC7F|nr:pentatricopeptide repeat-containing protein At1g71210, mitochondrial [Malania oleifera]XP_057954355.1 pentatricopeptide repeat-containing protein At1g71210, mitochondrial [Malania oleifera]XP_057954356.1 pentatricopeptide repeat-containing protein At1g71210, mitochondrial [Malania oleifera]XP_057954357.1 pentatricopeptide repeat-containing protein At1g71210, mitochondrial [Malania oleifera]